MAKPRIQLRPKSSATKATPRPARAIITTLQAQARSGNPAARRVLTRAAARNVRTVQRAVAATAADAMMGDPYARAAAESVLQQGIDGEGGKLTELASRMMVDTLNGGENVARSSYLPDEDDFEDDEDEDDDFEDDEDEDDDFEDDEDEDDDFEDDEDEVGAKAKTKAVRIKGLRLPPKLLVRRLQAIRKAFGIRAR